MLPDGNVTFQEATSAAASSMHGNSRGNGSMTSKQKLIDEEAPAWWPLRILASVSEMAKHTTTRSSGARCWSGD